MDKVTGKLTVFFEGPFWVGIFERLEAGKLSACRVVFGAEPKDAEVWGFVLEKYGSLRFGPGVEAAGREKPANPKRARREAGRQMQGKGVGTKSQQALQLLREGRKAESRKESRAQKQAEQERQFARRQQKKKQKHRGR